MWEVMPHFMKDVCPLFNYTICVIPWYIFILKHCHCGLSKYDFSEWYHSVSWQWEKCKDVCKVWQSIPLTGHKDEHCGDLRRSVMMLTTREMEVPTLFRQWLSCSPPPQCLPSSAHPQTAQKCSMVIIIVMMTKDTNGCSAAYIRWCDVDW